MSKIVGVMFPPLFGCRTNTELCGVRGWDKNLPTRLLGALPKRSWIKRLRRLGLEVLVPLWHYAASKSAATHSRWQCKPRQHFVYLRVHVSRPCWIGGIPLISIIGRSPGEDTFCLYAAWLLVKPEPTE